MVCAQEMLLLVDVIILQLHGEFSRCQGSWPAKSKSELNRSNANIAEMGQELQVRSGFILIVDTTEGLKAIAHSGGLY